MPQYFKMDGLQQKLVGLQSMVKVDCKFNRASKLWTAAHFAGLQQNRVDCKSLPCPVGPVGPVGLSVMDCKVWI